MAIFPILESEVLIQENDKLRLDVIKSFVSDSTAISKWEIKASKLGSFIDVTSLSKRLDWAYAFTVEVDTVNNKLDFKDGAGALVATLATGAYTLAALATEIKTKMDAAGTLVHTVAVSSDNKITISAPSAFSLLVDTGANAAASIFGEIGFSGDDLAGLATYTGEKIKRVNRTVSVKITNSDDPTPATNTISETIEVVSEIGDNLFSTDQQLVKHRHDVLKYIPDGRSSFKNMHRRVQELILAWLDTEGYVDYNSNKFTAESLVDVSEVSDWATMYALQLIFEELSNAIDDVYAEWAKKYEASAKVLKQRAILRIDMDNDGALLTGEGVDIRSGVVVRR